MDYKYDKKNKIIYIENAKKELEVFEDNYPSKPILSPNKERVAYIAPFEWETLSKLYVLNLKTGNKKILIDSIDGELVPKYVIWVTDNILAIIMGYRYGTVAIGGNVMLLDMNKGETKYITRYPTEIQVTQIKLIDNIVLHIKGIEYIDDNFNDTKDFIDEVKLDI